LTTRVAILAQDLIWQDRLARAVLAASAEPVAVRSSAELPATPFLIVDLTALAYDPDEVVGRAVAAGTRVLAVGQHDDPVERKRILAAGADRVLAYRKLFEDGPSTVARWLAS
jgi:hypothetical protein